MSEEVGILTKMDKFFAFNLSGYQLFFPKVLGVRCAFYKNFPEKNLSIVVFAPCVVVRGGLFEKGKEIKALLKTTKGPIRVVLKNTRVQEGWREVLFNKIQSLEALAGEIRRCNACGDYYTPLTCKRGKFVSMKCFSCGRWSSTTYGTGLKTRLHKYLIKEVGNIKA
ncbi:MAG: hypothetical protein ACOCUF_00930 [Patescibacteria group bacterium]